MKRRGQAGAQIVELGFLLPVLVLILMATMHFGYTFWVYLRLEKAVHDAARYGSMRTYQATAAATYIEQVRNVAITGKADGTGDELVDGLAGATIDVVPTIGIGGAPTRVAVTITNYQMPINLYIFESNLAGKPTASFPFMGRYAPF